jgi:hypothetical protein
MVSRTVPAAPRVQPVPTTPGWALTFAVAVPTAAPARGQPQAQRASELPPEVDLLWPSECERLARLHAGAVPPATCWPRAGGQ